MWWTPWLWSLRTAPEYATSAGRRRRCRRRRRSARDLIGCGALDASRSDSRIRQGPPASPRRALAAALVVLALAGAGAAMAQAPARAAAGRFLLGVNAGYWGPREPRDLRRV